MYDCSLIIDYVLLGELIIYFAFVSQVNDRVRQLSLDDEPVVLRQRVNSLEASPAKSNHRLSLPVAEIRSASFENLSPVTKSSSHQERQISLPVNSWRVDGGDGTAVSKRTMSETVGNEKDDHPQRKKISRFLSFFRKSKHSKVDFGKRLLFTWQL